MEVQEYNYEVIVGTGVEDDDQLAIAKATSVVENAVPDVTVWGVSVYDGGGVGLLIHTDCDPSLYWKDSFETVEEIPVLDPED